MNYFCRVIFLVTFFGQIPGIFNSRSSCESRIKCWGYKEVRKGINLFWTLYYTQHASGYKARPIVLWIQGGPGQAATTLGDLIEIGPYHVNGTQRQESWVNHVSVLFVDSPAGVGFSYANGTELPSTDVEVIDDLLSLMKALFDEELEAFQSSPLYVFGESYAGKWVPMLAKGLVERRDVKCKLVHVAMLSPWTSPLDNIVAYGRKMHYCGIVDSQELVDVEGNITLVKQFMNAHLHQLAAQVHVLSRHNFDVYNCVFDNRADYRKDYAKSTKHFNDNLSNFKIIPQDFKYKALSHDVNKRFEQVLMVPAVKEVEYILDKGIGVSVLVGQFDVIVNNLGTEKWVYGLNWSGSSGFLASKRRAVSGYHSYPIAYYKKYKNLEMYWILSSGHMIPRDTPETALMVMLRMLPRPSSGHADKSQYIAMLTTFMIYFL